MGCYMSDRSHDGSLIGVMTVVMIVFFRGRIILAFMSGFVTDSDGCLIRLFLS